MCIRDRFNIADLFERAVDAVPNRTAVVCGDASLTFAEFDVEANKMANHLLAEGIGAGDHIEMCIRDRRHTSPDIEWPLAWSESQLSSGSEPGSNRQELPTLANTHRM